MLGVLEPAGSEHRASEGLEVWDCHRDWTLSSEVCG